MTPQILSNVTLNMSSEECCIVSIDTLSVSKRRFNIQDCSQYFVQDETLYCTAQLIYKSHHSLFRKVLCTLWTGEVGGNSQTKWIEGNTIHVFQDIGTYGEHLARTGVPIGVRGGLRGWKSFVTVMDTGGQLGAIVVLSSVCVQVVSTQCPLLVPSMTAFRAATFVGLGSRDASYLPATMCDQDQS